MRTLFNSFMSTKSVKTEQNEVLLIARIDLLKMHFLFGEF